MNTRMALTQPGFSCHVRLQPYANAWLQETRNRHPDPALRLNCRKLFHVRTWNWPKTRWRNTRNHLSFLAARLPGKAAGPL